jgi:hypothetical protein
MSVLECKVGTLKEIQELLGREVDESEHEDWLDGENLEQLRSELDRARSQRLKKLIIDEYTLKYVRLYEDVKWKCVGCLKHKGLWFDGNTTEFGAADYLYHSNARGEYLCEKCYYRCNVIKNS